MNNNEARMTILVGLGIAFVLFVAGCSGSSRQSSNDQTKPPAGPNLSPIITAISPNSAVAGGAGFALTISGANFVAASVVNFGGTAKSTTFISESQLIAAIPASSISATGNAAVTVTNPAADGGTSNAVNFTITSANPVPHINSLLPNCAPAGGQGFVLSVSGSSFVVQSIVRWNGNDRATTISDGFNGPFLTAQIPPSDISAASTSTVTVFNPAPGGGVSNSASFGIGAGGFSPQSIAVDPKGRFAYVANTGCPDSFAGSVSMFTVDAISGALMPMGSVTADFGAHSIAVDPSGKFVYVANDGDFEVTGGSLSAFTISATTGALISAGTVQAPCAQPPAPGSCAPVSVAVDPTGKFAYAANEGGFAPTSVSTYAIDATTGALTKTGLVAAGSRAIAIALHPTAAFAYSANQSDPPGFTGSVSVYATTSGTGVLTYLRTISAGTDPVAIAVDPTGKFAYVANSGSNDVSMYSIDTNSGFLSSIGTIAAGTQPASVAVDPTGRFAYVVNFTSDDVSIYSINTTTGALSVAGTIAAGTAPSSIAIHPAGKFVYVTNSGSNDISIYSIDSATGTLTLIGTIGS